MQNVTQIWLCACTFSVVLAQFIYFNLAATNDFYNGDIVLVASMSTFTAPLLQLLCEMTTRLP